MRQIKCLFLLSYFLKISSLSSTNLVLGNFFTRRHFYTSLFSNNSLNIDFKKNSCSWSFFFYFCSPCCIFSIIICYLFIDFYYYCFFLTLKHFKEIYIGQSLNEYIKWNYFYKTTDFNVCLIFYWLKLY